MWPNSNYTLSQEYLENLRREAANVHLARQIRDAQPRRPGYRPLLVQIGRQMSHLGEQLQEHYRDETLPGLAIES